MFWGLGLWLAAHEPRSCRLNDELPTALAGTTDHRGPEAEAARLTQAPLRGRAWNATIGILDPGGIAVLTDTTAGQPAPAPPAADEMPEPLILGTAGFGPRAPELAAELAAHVRAWDQEGQPGIAGLRIDAYPRSSADEPRPVRGGLVMERPCTRFVIYRT